MPKPEFQMPRTKAYAHAQLKPNISSNKLPLANQNTKSCHLPPRDSIRPCSLDSETLLDELPSPNLGIEAARLDRMGKGKSRMVGEVQMGKIPQHPRLQTSKFEILSRTSCSRPLRPERRRSTHLSTSNPAAPNHTVPVKTLLP